MIFPRSENLGEFSKNPLNFPSLISSNLISQIPQEPENMKAGLRNGGTGESK